MEIQFFCPRWGSEGRDWQSFFEDVLNAGYDGVEYAIPARTTDQELDTVWELAAKMGMLLIAQHYDTTAPEFSQHLDLYHVWLERISKYPSVKISSQTGRDFFTFDQNRQLIELAMNYAAIHETHRGKFSFAAHITKPYLEQIPDLRLTLDASHWCCVAESLLQDQPEAIGLAIQRTDHIHARIGFEEGPQVPDFRQGDWNEAMNCHLGWWEEVVDLKKESGENLTITPEWGPYPYMHNLPGTTTPLAEQWDVNLEMMRLLRDRF